MTMRKATIEKVSKLLMNAMNDGKLESVSDIESVIRKATISPKQLANLDKKIETQRAKLKELEDMLED